MKNTTKRAIAATLVLSLSSAMCVGVISGCGSTEKEIYKTSNKNLNSYFYEEDIYHDQAYIFMSPLQPKSDENVTLRLKVKRGLASEVNIKYSFDISSSAEEVTFYTAPMVFERADDNLGYDYWIGIIPANGRYYRYHFELINDRETVWFDTEGVSDEQPTNVSGDWYVLPDFHVPEWSQGAVWYSVMPDSYYNGNSLNDKAGMGIDNVWGSSTHAGMTDYFGGDIFGLMSKMDYLKGLNITSLFINPIWVTAHNAGYGTYDFFQIDSAYGNDTVFFDFVNALHKEDLKLMCDAVIQYANINNILYNATGMYPDLYGDKYDKFVQYDEYGNPKDSGWGGPMIDFSKKIARDYLYSTDQSFLISYILKYSIDGWRMDVGNTLSGSDLANWGTSTQILSDIRKYIKAAGEDILFLTEHAVEGQLTDGVLDSKWNYAFESAVEEWVKGISNANILSSSLKSSVLAFPRGVSNASYNHLTSHDTRRLYDIIGQDDVSYLSAVLLQMTYVGSPVIYYGEEIGLSRPDELYSSREHSFDESMNWDESTWNYDIYHFYSALTSLRKEYEDTFRNGAYVDLYSEFVGNENDIFAFARYADKSVITLLNRKDTVVKNFEIDVNMLSFADGTILTDYMTGRTYEVKGGKVAVDIYPSGTVLVTGKAGAYRNEFEIFDSSENGEAVTLDDGTYCLTGSGTIGATDKLLYLAGNGFNNTALEAEIVSSDGDFVLAIRDDGSWDSAFYGVKISGDTATQIYRLNQGSNCQSGATAALSGAKKIKLARTFDNMLRVYIDSGSGYRELNEFAKEMPFDYHILLGAAPLDGSAKLKLNLCPLEEQTGTDFNTFGSQTILMGDKSSVALSEGSLVMSGSGQSSFAVTRAHYTDFTQKATVAYTPAIKGDFAGLTVMQSEKNYIVAGRYFDGEKVSLMVGQVINGKLCVYSTADDPTGEITLLMQKSGSYYQALYSTDGAAFTPFGEISVGYSELYAGVVRSGSSDLSVREWCFGDGIATPELAKHYSVGELNFAMQSGIGNITYTIGEGDWKYVTGGIAQTSKTAENTLYNFSAGQLSDFSATFTLNVTDIAAEGDGSYVGVAFARKSLKSAEGYTLRMYDGGKVKLFDPENKELASGNTSLKVNSKLQFTLIVKGDVLALYEGNDPQLVLYYKGLTNTKGYFGWLSEKAAYELYSYNVYEPASNVIVSAGEAYVQESVISSELVDLELSPSQNYNYVTMSRIGVSDFALSYNLQLNRINTVYRGYADVAFGIGVGASHLESGIVVRFSDQGRLSLYADGEQVVKDVQTSVTNTSSFFVAIAYVNGELKIYTLNYSESGIYKAEDLVLEYTYRDRTVHSGAIAFYSQNASVRYNALRGYGLSDGTDYTTLDLYRNIYINEPLPGDPEIDQGLGCDYRNDFDRNRDLATILKYSGSVTIRNGSLVVNGSQNWDAGAAISTGRYQNFELTTRVKVDNADVGGGFVGIEFYKSAATVNHQASALTLILYYDGSCTLFIGNDTLTGYSVKGAPDGDGYYTVHLIVKDGKITFWLGDDREHAVSVEIALLTNNADLTDGYISLNAGCNIGYFDYLDIKVLKD